MQTSNTPEQEDYNAAAIKTAAKLHSARLAIRKGAVEK